MKSRFLLSLGVSVAMVQGGMGSAIAQSSLFENPNTFDVCATELLQSGLSAQEAASACGEALEPDELSLCVLSVSQEVGVSANAALDSCFRVRRPAEFATCALEISQETAAIADNIIDSCRRSLRPLRHSDCAVGLTRQAQAEGSIIPPDVALEACLDAEAFPRVLDPEELIIPEDTIPEGQETPTLPIE